MGWLDGNSDPGREARAQMARAEEKSRRGAQAADDERAGRPSRPRRYRLYDRIASKVSLTAINIVIAATALLLVIALVYGIATGTPG